ncbi:hypothetical protein Dsin_022543 [Dipteronia sinensis]|uniref:Uncharacterized protein n=1 Tax=Dipteronia sinensis TaxID=43782 RepID=A0AAE0A1Z6_9ROSI|nr:hypothetical protein Dsin_022543 [Dipteronia sinensis]
MSHSYCQLGETFHSSVEIERKEPTTTQQLGVVLGGSRRVRCDPSAEPGHYGHARGCGGGSRGRWLGFDGSGESSWRFSDGTLSFEGFSSATSSSSIGDGGESEDTEKLLDRSINATIVLAAGTFAITKLLTIDQDYWQILCGI